MVIAFKAWHMDLSLLGCTCILLEDEKIRLVWDLQEKSMTKISVDSLPSTTRFSMLSIYVVK